MGVMRLCGSIVALCLTSAWGLAPQPPLSLEDFEDDDCIESPAADVLMQLMNELGVVLDQVLQKLNAGEDKAAAWAVFDVWAADGRMDAMQKLGPAVLARPYCEPGKIAWLATTCLLLLREGGPESVLECAASVDEDLLEQMTERSKKHHTRLHLVLRSPWPAFRLLDLLVRLYPENGSTRMGACKKNTKWNSDPDVFDWPHFKSTLSDAVDGLVLNESMFKLQHADGPLSRQYKARWLRIQSFAPMKESVAFSDDVFDAYREHHYQAGCHLGVISCYALQILQVNLRDVEGRLQKQVSSVAQLVNIHAPFQHTAKTDWPLFRVLFFASLLQRAPPDGVWRGSDDNELTAKTDAARQLVTDVERAVEAETGEALTMPEGQDVKLPVFVTAAWGWMSERLGRVLARWPAVSQAPVVVLARDREAASQCAAAAASAGAVRCVEAPQRLGVEAMVAKYLAMAAVARFGITTVWLDLDVFVVTDPTSLVQSELAKASMPDLVFSRHLISESVSPAVLIARGSPQAVSLLMGYAGWLRENPFLLDHQGWDQFLNHREGDFAGGFDYKGRNITLKDDEGPKNTFLTPSGLAPADTRWSTVSSGFGSGDGWLGKPEGLVLFHFWGADEAQSELFDAFYPRNVKPTSGLESRALELVLQYRRKPSSGPSISALLGKAGQRGGSDLPLHLVEMSYAHGCCAKSLKRNQQQALKVGADEARAYGKADLGPDWASRHELVLSQRRGAGWWLWKPYLVLKTLKDPAVPWNRGVVLWVDAGNYLHADPRPLLSSALQGSDVLALRLKWCLEHDWTSGLTLQQLNVSSRYAVVDRPQLGAYFLAFRKTEVSIAFVEEWLRLSEDPESLLGMASRRLGKEGAGAASMLADEEDIPSFMTHQADQSIFSLLFKRYGFRAVSLEEGHRVVTLDRWRE